MSSEGAQPWAQDGYDLRFDWASSGATNVGCDGVLVVVDVLSFTTSVTVAVERGVSVYPAAWRDERAAELARAVDAELAVGRTETTAERPWSLSPAALLAAPAPARLVLPSPNGSAIAAAARGAVVAGCLRNASAVARWLHEWQWRTPGPVTVLAAGERWPDGSLRPALEDLLGAGAVLSAVAARGSWDASPEAVAARVLHDATSSVPDAVRRCASGVELTERGYGADIDVAVELDASSVVPVLTHGVFRHFGIGTNI